MNSTATQFMPVTFLPALCAEDELVNYWLLQVTYRVRREICWLWHERGLNAGQQTGSLPPFSEKLGSVLDLSRYVEERARFFATDETAAYLSGLLAKAPPCRSGTPRRGSFAWLAAELDLDRAGCFVLAFGLSRVADSAAGTAFAACLNDPSKTYPTLALAQRLWDEPEALLSLVDAGHPLFRSVLFPVPNAEGSVGRTFDWETPFQMPVLIARELLYPGQPLPDSLRLWPVSGSAPVELPSAAKFTAGRLKSETGFQIVPILGQKGSPLAEIASAIGQLAGRKTASVIATTFPLPPATLRDLCSLCWLRGLDLFVSAEALECDHGHPYELALFPFSPPPLTIYMGVYERAWLKRLPAYRVLPPLTVPPLSFRERHRIWTELLLRDRRNRHLQDAVSECARRFRYERDTIDAICRELVQIDPPLKPWDLTVACRAEVAPDLGELACPVTPRFEEKELMLPPKQARQFGEIVTAMERLTRVHYEWGTAQAWNESGLCALFAGPPGTGKTMAAEVLAQRLDLPLYRIDLSQVVNKYIGETEKNLRKLFDAADSSDVILFFDEANALFGKRTEVKDAHDRYANLEISYLLERMERFKGLAVLATNRKRDLDEAFLRRLRFLIEFPLPGYQERLRIWRQVIPDGVDGSDLDLDFLARQFPLAGGHIRSIVFHACLQCASRGARKKLTMAAVVAAVKAEFDKLDRVISHDQFGPYARFIH